MSIGIPTFNRAAVLERAVESCRAQTHAHLEIVVSDNASTDGTAELCRRLGAEDERIVVVRQDGNVGLDANFRAVLERATGTFFMWLADDDWLDPEYVAVCVAALARDPRAAIAGGDVEYTLRGKCFRDSLRPCVDGSPGRRIRAYLRRVSFNGSLCGLMRREDVHAAEWPNTLAGDWYFMAQIASRGRMLVEPSVLVHRSLSGSSSDMRGLARSYGVAPCWGPNLHLWAARLLVPPLLAGSTSFGLMSRGERVWTALHLVPLLTARWAISLVLRQPHVYRALRLVRRGARSVQARQR
ncbi:MAG: glycosyltransferase [Actinomycetota bacterium]|nr:glycosyltransferase [Actinomycetota bacterium]